MQVRRTTRRRATGPAAFAMAGAGVLAVAVAKRRRAASADEPLEPGGLPPVDGGTTAEKLASEREADELTLVRALD